MTMPFEHVIDLPRGIYSRKRLGDQPKDEADHFIGCPACGGWIDCRDLVLAPVAAKGPTLISKWATQFTRDIWRKSKLST
jgi:hypothetical protein